jgi:hypothetical protein
MLTPGSSALSLTGWDLRAGRIWMPEAASAAQSLSSQGAERVDAHWLAQRLHEQAAGQGHAASTAEVKAAERRQALADLADICATAAEHARPDLPDLRWDDHGDVQRFHIDDIRLDLVLWLQIATRHNEGLILAGEVSAVVNGRRQRMSN